MPEVLGLLLALLATALLGPPAMAGTLADVSSCAGISASDKARVETLSEQHYLYDCCEDTVANCLAEATPCPLARRLTGDLCRRVQAGETDAQIDAAMKLRARSMMPGGPQASIDLAGVPVYGEPEAPVHVVLYVCARCPFCASTTLALLEDLKEGGALHGKVQLHLKIFPLKGHAGSVEAGMAAIAAQEQGRFWPYLTLMYEEFAAFSVTRLPTWAERADLDLARYNRVVADPTTRDTLVAWKREGIANGVVATPTAFIDGRPYQGDMHAEPLVDVLLEEYERLTWEE